jgi:hypothetical protein
MRFIPRIISFFLFLVPFNPAFSQQVESLHSVNVGYPDVGYSYEHALGKQFSINVEAGANWSFQYGANNVESTPIVQVPNINQPKEYTKNSTEITFSPILQLEPRYYYNVNKRFKGDRFTNNSASFFCISSGVRLDRFSFRNNASEFYLVPKWGFRRAMGNHFIFESKIGGGLQFRQQVTKFVPGLDIKFGYVF